MALIPTWEKRKEANEKKRHTKGPSTKVKVLHIFHNLACVAVVTTAGLS